jgi:hypothetical protein
MKHRFDTVVEPSDPFFHCKLGRSIYAEPLTRIIADSNDGLVLAINNEWGVGKTTFIKMWERFLTNNEYKTIYLNAWESDYNDSPLVAFLAELKMKCGKENQDKLNNVFKKGTLVLKSAIPAIVESISKYAGAGTGVSEIMKKLFEGAGDILSQEVDSFIKKKEDLKEFRKHLEDYVIAESPTQKLVFFVDELDRCRPSYSVELLEVIKHFFSVKGIAFVLSIDKEQLCHSINGFYGSAHFNSTEYLRRFIDLEFTLPILDKNNYIDHLVEVLNFRDFFLNEIRVSNSQVNRDKIIFKQTAYFLSHSKNLNLRQIEKLMTHSRIALRSFNKDSYVFPNVLLLIIFLKQHQPNIYQNIQLCSLRVDIFSNEIFECFKSVASTSNINFSLDAISKLLILYNKRRLDLYDEQIDLLEQTPTKEYKLNEMLTFKTLFIQELDEGIKRNINSRLSDITLDHLLNKIDFAENFK